MSDQMGKSLGAIRLAQIIEACLENVAGYKLFDMLAHISQLDQAGRLEYISQMRATSIYTEEEIQAIARLILTGTALDFKYMIDRERDRRIQREIEEMMQ